VKKNKTFFYQDGCDTILKMRKRMEKDTRDHIFQVKKITLIGMVVNIVLSVLKFILGIIGSSQAVVADAVHSLSDLSTDIAVLLGVKFWSAPPDEKHPYGHGRIETMVTTLIGLILVAVALKIGYNALVTIKSPDIRQPTMVAFSGAFLSIILKEILYRWTLVYGKRIKSTAVIANAWHHRSDALSSIPVAGAVIISMINPKWSFVDHVGALIVSLFILATAWKIIKPALMDLTDSTVDLHIRDRIKHITLNTPDVRSAHAIRARRIGSGIYLDLHIMVDGSLTVLRGHDISAEVKKRLLENVEDVVDVVVHLEPHETGTGKT
jgi:cation diffusion facilitator family transporter